MSPAVLIPRRLLVLLSLLLIVAAYTSCKYTPAYRVKSVSFKNVTGINFIEVRRRFADGRSFNKYGYELTPSWKLAFYSDDSAKVFSPDSGRYLDFHVTRDHDSLFYVARAWFRAKKVTKDSLVCQVMKVQSNVIYLDKSSVYITFYSDKYIKDKLHTTPEALMGKDRGDTLFVKKRIAEINVNTDSAFAASEPVIFISKSPLLKIEKVKVAADIMNNYDNSDDHMFPEFKVTINKAYEDFNYSFWATVDMQGQIHYQQSRVFIMDEFKESTIHTIKAIIDGYLKIYLKVTPGKTLNMPHNSYVILNVEGKKAG